MANLRLARFVGDRIARQAIMYERRIECDSDVGRMICDEVIEPGAMDETIARVIDRLTGSGVVGSIGNRRALRFAAEPLDTFRRYAALYAREQAYCHFSPALISNLEHLLERAEPAGVKRVRDAYVDLTLRSGPKGRVSKGGQTMECVAHPSRRTPTARSSG